MRRLILLLLASRESNAQVSSGEQTTLLSAHNAYRATHCAGDLTWDATLASAAQAWADTCATEHTVLCSTDSSNAHCRGTDPTTLAGSVGENMAWGGLTATEATDNWYNEYTNPGYSFADSDDGGQSAAASGNSGTGHFTQVVWKATTKLGCGVKTDCNFQTFFSTSDSWAASTTVWVCMCVLPPCPRPNPVLAVRIPLDWQDPSL